MPRPHIVATNRLHAEAQARIASFATLEMNPGPEPWPRAELLRRAAGADGLLAFMTDRVDDAFLGACPRLRAIACALKGTDNFDLAACRARGVALGFVPDLLTVPTAELAVGLMLALGRHILAGDALVRGGRFAGWRPALYGTGLAGSRVGILGMGALGQALARRLHGFDCTLHYADPHPLAPDAAAALGLVRTGLAELLASSDWLVVAAPLRAETLHLLDAPALRLAQPGLLLVNPARGSVVAEAAVAEALAEGRLGGYATDVFECEDWARTDRPTSIDPRLLAHPRTVFTPHLGSAVAAARIAIELSAAEDLAAFFAGRPMPGAVPGTAP